MAESSEADLRNALTDCYRYLDQHRLTELASGNVSCRCGDAILISPTGATATTIAPERFVKVGLEGEIIGAGRPSSELAMHLSIYRHVPDAGALVHTHSDHCVGLASCRLAIPGFHYLVGSFGGSDVPCAPYAVFGSGALASGATRLLQDRYACLLANHGAVTRGPTIEIATMLAHRLEILARQYLLARQAGEPKLLTEAEFAEYHAAAKRLAYD